MHGFRRAWWNLQKLVQQIWFLSSARGICIDSSWACTVRRYCRGLKLIFDCCGPFFGHFLSFQVYFSYDKTKNRLLHLPYVDSWGVGIFNFHGLKLRVFSICLLHPVDLGDYLSVHSYLLICVEEGKTDCCFADHKCKKNHKFPTRTKVDEDNGNYIGHLRRCLDSSSGILHSCYTCRSKVSRHSRLDKYVLLPECHSKSIYLLRTECELSQKDKTAGEVFYDSV
ncbi:hypothetical protein ACROYT_G000267 [Oculina patagonica]